MVCAFGGPFRDQCLYCNVLCFGRAGARQAHHVCDQVSDCAVGSRARISPGLGDANVHALARQTARPIGDQAGLPDPGIASQPDRSHCALSNGLDGPLKHLQRILASDERRPSLLSRQRRGRRALRPDHDFMELDRSGQSAHGAHPDRPGVDLLRDQALRRSADQYGPRGRHLLEPRRKVYGLAVRPVVRPLVLPDDTYQHLAGIDADAERGTGNAAGFIAGNGCPLHLESRHAGTQGVIFLRQGSAEQCNKTVPEQLADGAAIGFDRVDQQIQRLAEIVPGLFRVRMLQQRGRNRRRRRTARSPVCSRSTSALCASWDVAVVGWAAHRGPTRWKVRAEEKAGRWHR